MTITVRLTGKAREVAGRSDLRLELPAGATVTEFLDALEQRWPALEAVRRAVVVTRNGQRVEGGARLDDDDVVALLPPVGGG